MSRLVADMVMLFVGSFVIAVALVALGLPPMLGLIAGVPLGWAVASRP